MQISTSAPVVLKSYNQAILCGWKVAEGDDAEVSHDVDSETGIYQSGNGTFKALAPRLDGFGTSSEDDAVDTVNYLASFYGCEDDLVGDVVTAYYGYNVLAETDEYEIEAPEATIVDYFSLMARLARIDADQADRKYNQYCTFKANEKKCQIQRIGLRKADGQTLPQHSSNAGDCCFLMNDNYAAFLINTAKKHEDELSDEQYLAKNGSAKTAKTAKKPVRKATPVFAKLTSSPRRNVKYV